MVRNSRWKYEYEKNCGGIVYSCVEREQKALAKEHINEFLGGNSNSRGDE